MNDNEPEMTQEEKDCEALIIRLLKAKDSAMIAMDQDNTVCICNDDDQSLEAFKRKSAEYAARAENDPDFHYMLHFCDSVLDTPEGLAWFFCSDDDEED
ncbi:hypothetical protein [Novosphingobium clariflavum]|uniref:Uncharacterized protein n=1 Tax=Novosphingobium clariflavum TaxID=2029884 RepID=A0ABV6S2F5_9SPHN|nr:hypothetical protein [Novosphingobium clariflavum]